MIELHNKTSAYEAVKVSAVGGDVVVLDRADSKFHQDMMDLCEDWNEDVHVDGSDYAAHYWGQDEDGDGWEVLVVEMKVVG